LNSVWCVVAAWPAHSELSPNNSSLFSFISIRTWRPHPKSSSETFGASAESPIVVKNEPVSFGTLWHVVYAADRALPAGTYLVSTKEFKVKNLPQPVRAELFEYLTGSRSTTQYLSSGIVPGISAVGSVGEVGVPATGVGAASGIAAVGASSQQNELARAINAATQALEVAAETPIEVNTMEDVVANEICTATRESVIRAPGKQFTYAKTLAQRIEGLELKYREGADSKQSGSSGSATASAAQPGVKRSSGGAGDGKRGNEVKLNPEDRIPIIIVPSSRTSLINLRNAAAFFQHGAFVDSSTVQQVPEGHCVVIQKPSAVDPNHKVLYHIIDNPSQLPASAWRRVVAMFVTGQTWQLEDIPIGKTPAEIFAQVPGYYLQYEGEAINENVKNWLVKKIFISRSKRHLDSMVVTTWWAEVTKWIAAHNANRRLIY